MSYADPFGLCPPQDNDPYTCPGRMGAFVMLGQMAPAINHEVAWFLPRNLAFAAGGLALEAGFGKLAGALFSRAMGSEAQSAMSAVRLAAQLTHEEASAVFTESGGLQADVIKGASRIIEGSDLKNPAVIQELTRDGSNIADWGKYSTQTFKSPAGDFQVHFYYNSATGAVNYGLDYKAVFVH